MDSLLNQIEVSWLSLDQLVPNPWNPNRMTLENERKLCHELKTRGFVAPLLVRPWQGRFQIIDGEHRVRLARELGFARVPAVVMELSETEARIKTLQLNRLRGEDDPERLSALLSELTAEVSAESLAERLPWSPQEIEQMIALTEKESEEWSESREAPAIAPPELSLFAVVVTPEQKAEIEAALQVVRKAFPVTEDGDALALICRSYHVS